MALNDDALLLCREGSAEEVSFLIEFLLWECEISQAPSTEQVTQWAEALRQRGGKFSRYAQMCTEWLQQENGQG